MAENINNYLAEFENLFSGLPESEFAKMEIVEFSTDSFLCKEGEAVDCLYFILKGVSEGIMKNRLDSASFLPYKIYKGLFIGLVETLSPPVRPRAISVVAKTPITTVKIDGAQLRSWQVEYSDLYNRIIQTILLNLFSARNIIGCCNIFSTTPRMAYYIAYLYEIYRYSCYPKGYENSVKIWDSRDGFSKILGLSVRTIDRALKELKDLNLISVSRAKIYVTKEQHEKIDEYIHSNV